MKRLFVLCAIALIPSTAVAKKPPVEVGPPSKAVTNEIVDVIAE